MLTKLNDRYGDKYKASKARTKFEKLQQQLNESFYDFYRTFRRLSAYRRIEDNKEQYKLRKRLNYKCGNRILTSKFKTVKDIVATLKDFEVNLEILRNNNPRKRKPEDKNKGKGKDKAGSTIATTVTVTLPKQSSLLSEVKQYKDQNNVP